jgi:hypothetical protein
MNLIAAADEPLTLRILYLLVTFFATIALTAFTLSKSRRFSDLLDALADERMTLRNKWDAFRAVWRSDG